MTEPSDDSISACAAAVMALVPHLTRAMIEEVRRIETPSRLTPPQARVLKLLTRVPVATLTEVADFLGVRKPTASVLVLKMVQQGLVSRKTAGTTRLALTLTKEGQAAIAALDAALTARMQSAVRQLAPDDVMLVLQAAQRLNHAFGTVSDHDPAYVGPAEDAEDMA